MYIPHFDCDQVQIKIILVRALINIYCPSNYKGTNTVNEIKVKSSVSLYVTHIT